MRLALAAAAVALTVSGPATAGRFAVGVERGASVAKVAARVEAVTGSEPSRSLAPLRALLVSAPSAAGLAGLPGIAYVERVRPTRRLAFAPSDPLTARQWYLGASRAFDLWPEAPVLPAVKVAVIDSGIDGTHEEFVGKIAAHRSFVGGSALTDQQGHGTFVAGEIAAGLDNGVGIAGVGFPAQLLIAKVTRADGTISLEAEAKAIRWAADRGARVINLSFGGLRDPIDRRRDTYSPLEAAAVSYAYRKGAVLVAAVGNGDRSPSTPWPYAWYPAALPHVIGVSALARDGSVPSFSNRDAIYNDVAAPGEDIFSTFPRSLTAARPLCAEQGYSSCAGDEFRGGDGTSFAAPQVSAAAALLLASDPSLRPDQVSALIERSAEDANPSNGCRRCALQRDSLAGWGRLDITKTLQVLAEGSSLPPADRLEPNDDAGADAQRVYGARRGEIRATIDFWDDQIDVYRLFVRRGTRLVATVRGPAQTETNLVLWKPGTRTVEGLVLPRGRTLAARSVRRGSLQQLAYRALAPGWYFLEVKISTPGFGPYTVRFAKA